VELTAGMKKFRAMIRGGNFAVRTSGRPEPDILGFYTFVYVEAVNSAAAELRAIEALRNDDELKTIVCNHHDNPPVLSMEELQELESFEGMRLPRDPFIFYSDNEK
jgi:hypothetical protein